MTGTDRSTHPNVVEYAVQTMIKRGKNPNAAAKDTAKKHHGSENMFFGPGPTLIDVQTLEEALWARLVDFTIVGMGRIKAGKEHFALDGTLQHFNQKPNVRAELKRRVIEKLGQDPFTNDDALKESTMSRAHDDAESAGEQYAEDQVTSDYFMDWVRSQLVEASRMDPDKVLPLETKADAKKIARNMLKQLEWDTKREWDPKREPLTSDNPREFYGGFRKYTHDPKVVDWLADEILRIDQELRGEGVEEASGRGGYVVAKGDQAREWSRHRTLETARKEAERLLKNPNHPDISIWHAADFDDVSGTYSPSPIESWGPGGVDEARGGKPRLVVVPAKSLGRAMGPVLRGTDDSSLRQLPGNGPDFLNASINRDQAVRMFKAGMSPADIAKAFPEVFSVNAEGLLGQKYDSIYIGSGRKETKYTILKSAVDEAIRAFKQTQPKRRRSKR